MTRSCHSVVRTLPGAASSRVFPSAGRHPLNNGGKAGLCRSELFPLGFIISLSASFGSLGSLV